MNSVEDIVPAEPTNVRRVADEARITAEDANEAAVEMRAISAALANAPVASSALSVFETRLAEMPADLDAVAAAHETVSAIMTRFADDVERLRDAGQRAIEARAEAEVDERNHGDAYTDHDRQIRMLEVGGTSASAPALARLYDARLSERRGALEAQRRVQDAMAQINAIAAEYDEVEDAAARQIDRAEEVFSLRDMTVLSAVRERAFDRRDALLDADSGIEFIAADGRLIRNTPEAWPAYTYELAGIDPDEWDTGARFSEIHDLANRAWNFYGTLYALNPDFEWAALAKFAGGTFNAAMRDIDQIRDLLEAGDLDAVADLLSRGLPPGSQATIGAQLAATGQDALIADFELIATTFHRMQKAIFDDIAWQHVAYHHGGLQAMEQMNDRGRMPYERSSDVWRRLAAGDRMRSTRILADIEQNLVIADDYDVIRNHSMATHLFTISASAVGGSPLPGGTPFAQASEPHIHGIPVNTPDRISLPIDVDLPTLRTPSWSPIGVDVDLPRIDDINLPDQVNAPLWLPFGNVSDRFHRDAYIQGTLLPEFNTLLAAGVVPDLVAVDVEEMGDARTLVPGA